MKKILITGASGFIGSYLCEDGHRRRYEVWAGMRKNSSRKNLQGEWLNFITLNLSDPAELKAQLSRFKTSGTRWDAIIHAGGATKCLHKEDFDKNNYECTKNLVDALIELDMVPDLFVYLSSLSVMGPVRETQVAPHPILPAIPLTGDSCDEFMANYVVKDSVYEEISDADTATPNTAYGLSKMKSESYLHSLPKHTFPYVIMRPTGVYGPREKDYKMMADSIKRHIDFSVGFKPQEITFVHVYDLSGAIYAAISRRDEEIAVREETKSILGKSYFVSDGFVYYSRSFSDLLQKTLGVGHVLHIKAPLWFLKAVSAVSEWTMSIFGKPSTLNGDKYKIMRQRNWRCDIRPMIEDLGYTPEWNLERGVEETFGKKTTHKD